MCYDYRQHFAVSSIYFWRSITNKSALFLGSFPSNSLRQERHLHRVLDEPPTFMPTGGYHVTHVRVSGWIIANKGRKTRDYRGVMPGESVKQGNLAPGNERSSGSSSSSPVVPHFTPNTQRAVPGQTCGGATQSCRAAAAAGGGSLTTTQGLFVSMAVSVSSPRRGAQRALYVRGGRRDVRCFLPIPFALPG